MRNINTLRAQKIQFRNSCQEIFDKAEAQGRRLTGAERTTLQDLRNQMEDLTVEMAAVEQELSDETNPNARLAAHEMGGNNGNRVYAKLSDQLVANGLRPTQACESLAPFASLREQMRAVRYAARDQVVDPRLTEILNINAALGGNESVPAEGGFLVIPEFAQELIKRTYDVALIANRCFKLPMASSRLIMHAVDEDSRKDGSRWGGILAYWLSESSTYTPTKPKFREMQLVSNKLIALTYATEEQLADGPAWAAYVNESVPQELAFQIDTAVYNGPGAGAPMGILNSGALLTIPKDSGQAAATVTVNNVLNIYTRMWARSRQNMVWFINQDVEPQLYTLALQNPTGAVLFDSPIYTPSGVRGNNGPYGLLLGKPVIPIEQASTLGTAGDIMAADMTQYILAQRSDVRADTSIHVAYLTGEQAFRFMLRLDGQPTWKKPLTPYQGTVTKSPFVVVATRS